MPTENEWFVENRVILATPSGIVTLEEFAKSNDRLVELIRNGAQKTGLPVHLFIDAKDVISQPSPLATRKVFTYTSEPSLGWTAIGGVGNPVMIFFTKIVSGVAGAKTRLFETPEEALSLLMKKDETLPDLLDVYRQKLVSS